MDEKAKNTGIDVMLVGLPLFALISTNSSCPLGGVGCQFNGILTTIGAFAFLVGAYSLYKIYIVK